MNHVKRKPHVSRLRKFATSMMSAAVALSFVPAVSPAAYAEEGGAIAFQSAMNYGSRTTDSFQDVAYTNDGGFVAVGYTFGDEASETPLWTLNTGEDGLIVKFDRDHKFQWATTIYSESNSSGYTVLHSVDILRDGRILVSGNESYNDSAGGKKIKGVSMYYGVIDPDNPDIRTEYHIGGTAGDQGAGAAATPDGGFAVAGWTASKGGYYESVTTDGTKDDEGNLNRIYSGPIQIYAANGTAGSKLPCRLYKSGADSLVAKFAADGTFQFCALENYAVQESQFNISNPGSKAQAMGTDSEGNIFVVANNAVLKGVTNGTLAKFNGQTGDLEWHKTTGVAWEDGMVAPEDPADQIKLDHMGLIVLNDGSAIMTAQSTNDSQTEDAFDTNGQDDSILLRYAADGTFQHAETIGTINDSASRYVGGTATPDGGYLVCGSASQVMTEDSVIEAGYDFGNYGGNDGVLIKYSADNKVEWSENYGTTTGDWLNAVTVNDAGEYLAAGESIGSYGNPAWANNGGIDAVVMSSGSYPEATVAKEEVAVNGNVSWADGTYTDAGDGYGGTDSITLATTIADGKIASISTVKSKDTKAYFSDAVDIYADIVAAQSTDVDTISGATYSSTGILEAVGACLDQAAGAHVVGLISGMDASSASSVQAAVDAYQELGTYARSFVTNINDLQAAADALNITITPKGAQAANMKETQPEKTADTTHSDTYWKLQSTHMGNIGAEALAASNLTGEGVKVAVIDSGLTGAHEDIDYSRILAGYDYINNCPMNDEGADGNEALIDTNGHGTAVTGIVMATADNGKGVAGLLSGVKIVPMRVNPVAPDKDTDGTSSRTIAQAITDAVDTYGVDVISTSLDVKDTDELAAACEYAASKDVIVCAAAGNSGTASSTDDSYIYPASYDTVISVGAVNADKKVRSTSQKNDKVFVTAPGGNIALLDLSRSDRCMRSSGTSYASPIVSSMAAAAKQKMPDLTPEQFMRVLQYSATDAGSEGYDNSYGYGIVNAEKMLTVMQDYASVTLDCPESISMMQDTTMDVQATVSNDWFADGKGELSWASSDESVATVSASGRVKAVAEGQATITVTYADGDKELAAGTTSLTVTQSAQASANKIAEQEQQLAELQKQLDEAKAANSASVEALEEQIAQLKAFVNNIANRTVTLAKTSFTYTGKACKPAVTIDGLAAGTDYKVAYANNTNAGTASVTVTGTGDYTGSKTATFTISKKSQKVTAKVAKKTYKAGKLKKKAASFKIGAKAKTALSYKVAAKKALKKFITVSKAGKVTMRKGARKGTYKVTVTAKATKAYNKAAKTVTIKVK